MLSGDFYKIKNFESTEPDPGFKHFRGQVSFNSDHSIFTGHFPGNPVVPAVCQIQIIKETIDFILNESTRLTRSDNIKFLSSINPHTCHELELDVLIKPKEPTGFTVTASLTSGTNPILKFKGHFEV